MNSHPVQPALIVEVARRLEVYREPVPDAAATFGWRYGSALMLSPEAQIAPLAHPAGAVTVADLLP